jgi:hypothetical protein
MVGSNECLDHSSSWKKPPGGTRQYPFKGWGERLFHNSLTEFQDSVWVGNSVLKQVTDGHRLSHQASGHTPLTMMPLLTLFKAAPLNIQPYFSYSTPMKNS